jgi:hypothetical protein
MKKKQLNPVVLGVGIFILFGVLILAKPLGSMLSQNQVEVAQNEQAIPQSMTSDQRSVMESQIKEQMQTGGKNARFEVPENSIILVPRPNDNKPQPSPTNIGSHWFEENSDAAAQTRKGGD